MPHKWREIYWYCMQNNQWKNIEDQLPTESPVELKDSPNLPVISYMPA